MTKWILTLLLGMALSIVGQAQNTSLEIQGKGNQLFLNHTVESGDTFFSMGRLYNVAPRDLAAYNHLSLDGILKVGEQLRIPLGNYNFTQSPDPVPFEAFVPLHHTVVQGETLFRLGQNYHKVPLDKIKKWNNLASDAVDAGSRMIVGYLKVNKAESALAGKAKQPVVNAIATVQPAEEKKVDPQPTPTEQTKPTPAREPVAEPAPDPSPTESAAQTPTPAAPDPQIEAVNVQASPHQQVAGTGYFQSIFNRHYDSGTPVTENGKASIFKSTSGWQDKKYYCFYNGALPGTVVKISDTTTGKSVYAKVLDAIPDIRRNDGLTLVLSNAGSDALEVKGDNFSCSVTYVK